MPTTRFVYRWDLDKTYLRTEFDTLRDLVRTAVEAPMKKRTMPGAAALMRELQRTAPLGIHVLSGSPELMRSRLEAKLRLDGIVWDTFTLKPTVQKLLSGNFGFVREQLGYKLLALLRSRLEHGVRGPEILFGDDAEADAYIYCLYADLLAERIPPSTLLEILRRSGADREDTEAIVSLAHRASGDDPVRHIFIHLERMSASQAFVDFGPRVCAFYNYFQPALVLAQAGAVTAEAALRVGTSLLDEHGFDVDGLVASFDDLVSRKKVDSRLGEAFRALGARAAAHAPLDAVARAIAERDLPPPSGDDEASIDYLSLFARDRSRAQAGKRRAKWRGFAR